MNQTSWGEITDSLFENLVYLKFSLIYEVCFIKGLLYMVKSSMYKDEQSLIGSAEMVSLIAIKNNVVLRTQPCGVPSI